MSQTHQAIVTIPNRLGLHARPAMMLVEVANKYQANTTLRRSDGDEIIEAKSIMQVMLLAAGQGTQIQVTGEGADAKEAVEAIVELIKRGFDED